MNALTTRLRSWGWSVSVTSATTSAARSDRSVLSVSGSAMTYPYPSSPLYVPRFVLVRAVRRVPEIGSRPGGGGAQHRGLPRQQRALHGQAPQRVRLGQHRLALRQVDHHRGGDDKGEQ